MANIFTARTFIDQRGRLSVLDQNLPFSVKRVYYIYGVGPNSIRAGHRHKRNDQILICTSGSCEIFVNDGLTKQTYQLNTPDQCLYLAARDWHTMSKFSPDAVLLVLASEHYDITDYIDEEYP